ncbi:MULTISPECIES: hypothetical protein [unclassified Shewanella]|uniref:hypothetical protein n=1 Tax=unclassified Shewanella TaxID=196818 RepID=UPI0021D803F2|nr:MULTISPECIES: hypothetical protein [unclassified Shewanella]MCU8034365.1 hypothetical protein [Shewanella sp. SM71]MCU8096072.1 hypothetical protein [Shewanella sp. SM102]
MGLPVTVYRYTDAGAPQLVNSSASEWITILKKCLVEGYGSKAPLGWTVAFEDALNFKIAFRNTTLNGGSGGYFQFNGPNTANATCTLRCAASMAALDSFIKQVPARGLQGQTTYRGWEIIGTSRGFYLILHRTNNLLMSDSTSTSTYIYFQMYFIGDIDSLYANDQSLFTLVSGTNGAATTNSFGVNHLTRYATFYDTDAGAGSAIEYSAIAFFPMIANTAYNVNAETAGLQHILSPVTLTCSNTTTDRNGVLAPSSLITPLARARIPGLYQSSCMGYRNDNWPIDVPMNSVMHTLLRSSYAPSLWINMVSWYE